MKFLLPPYMHYFFNQWRYKHSHSYNNATIHDVLFANDSPQGVNRDYQTALLESMPSTNNNIVIGLLWWAVFTILSVIDLVIFTPIGLARDIFYGCRAFDSIPIIGPIFGLLSSLLSFDNEPHSKKPNEREGFILFTLMKTPENILTKNSIRFNGNEHRIKILPFFKTDKGKNGLPTITPMNLLVVIPNLVIWVINSAAAINVMTGMSVIVLTWKIIKLLHHLTNLGIEKKDDKFYDNRLVTPLYYDELTGDFLPGLMTIFSNLTKWVINTCIVMPLNLAAYLVYTLPVLSANRAISEERVSPKLADTNARTGDQTNLLWEEGLNTVYLLKNEETANNESEHFKSAIKNTWRTTLAQIILAPLNLAYMILTPPEYREILTKKDFWNAKTANGQLYVPTRYDEPTSQAPQPSAPPANDRGYPGYDDATSTTTASPGPSAPPADEVERHTKLKALSSKLWANTPSRQKVKGFMATYVAPLTGLPLLYSLTIRAYRAGADAIVEKQPPKTQVNVHTIFDSCDFGPAHRKQSQSTPDKEIRFTFSYSRLVKNIFRILVPFSTDDKLPRYKGSEAFSQTHRRTQWQASARPQPRSAGFSQQPSMPSDGYGLGVDQSGFSGYQGYGVGYTSQG